MSDEEEEELSELCLQQPPRETKEDVLEISLHTIAGAPNPKTMRLLDRIGRSEVVILLDASSIHNFLDPAVVTKSWTAYIALEKSQG